MVLWERGQQQQTDTISRLIDATLRNDVVTLAALLNSTIWYTSVDSYGCNLLQIAIKYKSRSSFAYLLLMHNFPLESVDIYNRTALMIALDGFVSEDIYQANNDFAVELIKKGAKLDRIRPNKSLLHLVIKHNLIDAAKLLIEKGVVDLNVQDVRGETLLHNCIQLGDKEELILMMLCYGVDPWIRDNSGCTAFEQSYSVWSTISDVLEENFFNFMFDKHTNNKVHPIVLMRLAQTESPLFQKIVELNVASYPCKVDGCSYDYQRDPFRINVGLYETKLDDSLRYYVAYLLCINVENFKILVEKFEETVAEFLEILNVSSCCFTPASIENLDLLMRSPLRPNILNFIQRMKASCTIELLIEKECAEEAITELILYLMSYGMVIDDAIALELVYKKFGYNDLFKVLLHMEIKPHDYNQIRPSIPAIIIYPSSSLETFLENFDPYPWEQIEDLVDYFVHPKLNQFCYQVQQNLDTVISRMETMDSFERTELEDRFYRLSHSDPDKFLQLKNKHLISRVEGLPSVPLLVQLARDASRKFITEKFKTTTSWQFYTILNWLPISNVHKKIISFEIKLY